MRYLTLPEALAIAEAVTRLHPVTLAKFSQIVDVEFVDDELLLRSDLASLDVWEIEVATLTSRDVGATIEQIDRVEERFGPLASYCGGCGIPRSAYHR